jgi:Uma2 family endonuclease
MSLAAPRSATYDDLLALPDNLLGQIVDGDLIASPRPVLAHARVASVLGMDLGTPFERGRGGPGGWWIVHEPELHLRSDILVPDLAGWRCERQPTPPDGAFATLAPDWVCEVLSPSTAGLDRIRKMPIYAREGVQHVWLVDPDVRSLEVYRREGSAWLRVNAFADNERVRAEPLAAVELELEALWKNGPPKATI